MQQAIRPNQYKRRWSDIEDAELEQYRFQTRQAAKRSKLDLFIVSVYVGGLIFCGFAWYGIYRLIVG
jgi:hypothetical protein